MRSIMTRFDKIKILTDVCQCLLERRSLLHVISDGSNINSCMIITFVIPSAKFNLNNYASFKKDHFHSALCAPYFPMPIRAKGNTKRYPDIGCFF